MELPPITEDDRRVASDAAEMVLPKQRPPAEVDTPSEPSAEPEPDAPLEVEARDDALDRQDDDSEPTGSAGAIGLVLPAAPLSIDAWDGRSRLLPGWTRLWS